MSGEDELVLYVLGPGWGIPFSSSAPFPVKLETWLRMAGIPYRAVVENNTGKGPKGKSPWIEQGPLRMADSELIIEHFAALHGIDFDAHLSPRERAESLAMRRLFEEHYHQAFEHALLLGEGSDDRVAAFARELPPVLRQLLPAMLRRNFRKQLYARGLGRHDAATILRMGKADLDAVSDFLGDKPYFMGDRPSMLDATALGFLGVSVYVEGDNPLFTYAAGKANLWDYCERMRAEFFPHTLPATEPAAVSAAG